MTFSKGNLGNNTCPKCGSSDWKSAALVYQSGMMSTSSKGLGGGITLSGDIVVGGMGSKGQQQSELSKHVAPPEVANWFTRANPFTPAGLIALASGGLWIWLVYSYWDIPSSRHPGWLEPVIVVLMIVSLISSLIMFFAPTPNPELDAKEKAEAEAYSRTIVCMRCGHVYTVEKGGSHLSTSAAPTEPRAEPEEPQSDLRELLPPAQSHRRRMGRVGRRRKTEKAV